MLRYTPPWSADGSPYIVVYGKKAVAARIVYPGGETMTGDLMRSPSHSSTLKLSISGSAGEKRRISIVEDSSGNDLVDSGITWTCVDDACDTYAVGGYLTRDKRKLPSMSVTSDPVTGQGTVNRGFVSLLLRDIPHACQSKVVLNY